MKASVQCSVRCEIGPDVQVAGCHAGAAHVAGCRARVATLPLPGQMSEKLAFWKFPIWDAWKFPNGNFQRSPTSSQSPKGAYTCWVTCKLFGMRPRVQISPLTVITRLDQPETPHHCPNPSRGPSGVPPPSGRDRAPR